MSYVAEDGTHYEPMDSARFWHIIETVRAESQSTDAFLERLTETLQALPAEDIVSFDLQFRLLDGEASTDDLRDAVNLILKRCTDTDFDNFRRWLVAQGQTVFEQALPDPDTLADVVSVDTLPLLEAFTHTMYNAYERKTGTHMPVVIEEQDLQSLFESLAVGDEGDDAANRGATERYETPHKRYPRLAEKFHSV